MSERLDKAKAAMEAIKGLDLQATDHVGLVPQATAEEFARLIRIAEVHASIAAAEAAERLADSVERPPWAVSS